MNISAGAKTVMTALVLVGAGLWLVLMDLGVNAGRIHYGVNVQGVDVGGMTYDEAVETLRPHASKLQMEPVVLSAEGMDCSFLPEDLGWSARTEKTVDDARAVGFGGGVFNALQDRLQSWFSGVSVDWARTIDGPKVKALVDECEKQAVALGLELDRGRMRGVIGRSIVTWPREIFEIPVSAN